MEQHTYQTSRGCSSLHGLFLRALGLIFLVANISYYVQYPGLLGTAGIEPVDRVLSKVFPTLQKLLLEWHIDEDSFVDALALLNIFLSSLVVVCGIVHSSVFLMLTLSYWLIARLGGVFYSFQWELLLLEVGATTTLCYAPTLTMRLPSHSNCTSACSSLDIGVWPLRFVLFKLMFMSGVVKLQADCPTWNQLTALEYHYASQPLPGPLAWYAHQLHPFFHRLSVAATLIIEIPLTFLLITPSSTMRRFGAAWQMALQILILLTGNYNFFNLLTIILCLPCLKLDKFPWLSANDSISINISTKKLRWSTAVKIIQYLFCLLYTGFTARKMIRLTFEEDSIGVHPSVTLMFTKQQCNEMITKFIPIAVCSTLVVLSAHLVLHIWAVIVRSNLGNKKVYYYQSRQIASLLLRGGVSTICIGVASVPFLFLTPELPNVGFLGSEFFIPLWFKIQAYQISNNYGLFRRMTGVGRQTFASSDSGIWGWGGISPSIVARPEIVLEGIFVTNTNVSMNGYHEKKHDEKDAWREINFRWKPGGVLANQPRQVAPHQPRLDWQMWFAALGGYQNNPWLIHFVSKLLDGCLPVIQLIDEPQLASGEEKLMKIRAILWDYDFTRLPTPWNKRIPNVTYSFTEYDSFWRAVARQPPTFWSRSNPRVYLPPIESGQADNYLIHHAFLHRTPKNPSGKVCFYGMDRCHRNHKREIFRFCRIVEIARKYRVEFVIPIFIFLCMQLIVILQAKKVTLFGTARRKQKQQ